MRFVSTRAGDRNQTVGIRDVLLSGLAPDGGLYMPEAWPDGAEAAAAAKTAKSYPALVAQVLAPYFAGWLEAAEIEAAAVRAYASFRHPDIVPLRPLGEGLWLLELFHGPTLAFKDLAMQLLAELYARALAEQNREVTIICATSGDTGGAAVDAFAGKARLRVAVLFPKGRISDVQRRMMTTSGAANVAAIAVDGDFDACQRIVKTLLSDAALCRRLGLVAVNSINWVRLAAQIPYYFSSAASVSAATGAREVSYVVPTGNFGDAFAGWAARRMGAPVGRICAAVNRNDIIDRALRTGRYAPRGVDPTISPSMDIEIASNFERMLSEASGRDGPAVAALMSTLVSAGGFSIPAGALAAMRAGLHSERADESECRAEIAHMLAAQDIVIDPHTAVGLVAAKKARAVGIMRGEIVCLATAHPAKFPDAVEAACGVRPALPPGREGLMAAAEHFAECAADAAQIRAHLLEGC